MPLSLCWCVPHGTRELEEDCVLPANATGQHWNTVILACSRKPRHVWSLLCGAGVRVGERETKVKVKINQ